MEDLFKDYRGQVDLAVRSQRAPDMRVMRGKALLDEAAKEMKFVENEPRGARSVEVGRTAHSRFVRRPDGLYTITFRVSAKEDYLKETLIAEVREMCDRIRVDSAFQYQAAKEALKEAQNSEKEGKDEE